MKLPQKFLILSLIGLMVASIPTYLYVRESDKALAGLRSEHQGLDPAAKSLKVAQLTQQHRAISALLLNGAPNSEEKQSAKQAETDKAYAALEIEVKTIGSREVSTQWDVVWRDWQYLRSAVSSKSITGQKSYELHSALVPEVIKLTELIGDYYGLSLDPDPDTYQLIQFMYYHLPGLTEELGRLRAQGTALLTKKNASSEERLVMRGLIVGVNGRLDQTRAAFSKAMAKNPKLEEKLGGQIKPTFDATAKISALAAAEIIAPETLSYDPVTWVSDSTAVIYAQFTANSVASAELEKMLTEKINEFLSTRWMMGLACLGLIAVAGYLAMLIMRSITGPLHNAITVAQSVASGNLMSDFDVGPETEVGQLLRALKAMNDSLRSIVSEVRLSADTIDAATRDIATGNADISTRIESQASNLEETASSMEELTSTVRQNTESARQASDLVQSASEIAGRGSSVVSQVVRTMGEINDSSSKIVDIISVIDGIAFQTNILALNAAVEAARAGEQGRGFAVVAGEVRTLAHRSATAAKEIKELINSSVEKVEAGNQLVGQAGQAMNEIMMSVQRITQIVSDIAMASTEQGSGIEQINQSVIQMDDMTQRNAALVEEVAAASASLEEQAANLVRAIGIFAVDDENTRSLSTKTRKPQTSLQIVAPPIQRRVA